ncbi:hypothetical protein B0T11DRAFT_102764 [Plectosphaerella cucumerina]|uniref:Nudix hydrolase domain-containing protein n=1 Tax=Plectosphaerella cucumerina TaxID=40658 RepID=A0A8K0TGW1_9PEZI|nr:hypothetical protein B0T11DRAFT_102764 [Plectosphaerella cucumerina]
MSQTNGGQLAPARSALPDNNPSPLAERALTSESRFLPSHRFIISCGTVTLDRKAGKVLLVYNKPNGIYQLPKGRKDIGEDRLPFTAIRETLEETGYDVQPLELEVPTRSTPVHVAAPIIRAVITTQDTTVDASDNKINGATNGTSKTAASASASASTPPSAAATSSAPKDELVDVDGDQVPEKGLTRGIPNKEPIACSHWYDAQTQALKMIFYFAAEADSTAQPREQRPEDAAKHEVYWIEYEDALERLWYDEERKAVEKALCDLRRSE